MQKNNLLKILAVTGLFVCSALPQLLLYHRGYYFTTNAPPLLKYPVNAGSFIAVAFLGHWYLKQAGLAFLPLLWGVVYALGGLFIAYEYCYHFIFPTWGAQTYLNTMGLFDMLVNPVPFVIAWLLLQFAKMLKKYGGQPPAQ